MKSSLGEEQRNLVESKRYYFAEFLTRIWNEVRLQVIVRVRESSRDVLNFMRNNFDANTHALASYPWILTRKTLQFGVFGCFSSQNVNGYMHMDNDDDLRKVRKFWKFRIFRIFTIYVSRSTSLFAFALHIDKKSLTFLPRT